MRGRLRRLGGRCSRLGSRRGPRGGRRRPGVRSCPLTGRRWRSDRGGLGSPGVVR